MNAARDTAFDWLFWRCFVLICVLCVLSVAQHQQQQQQKTFTTQIAYTHNGWSREKERKKKSTLQKWAKRFLYVIYLHTFSIKLVYRIFWTISHECAKYLSQRHLTQFTIKFIAQHKERLFRSFFLRLLFKKKNSVPFQANLKGEFMYTRSLSKQWQQQQQQHELWT